MLFSAIYKVHETIEKVIYAPTKKEAEKIAESMETEEMTFSHLEEV